jgi:hypothetical protein
VTRHAQRGPAWHRLRRVTVPDWERAPLFQVVRPAADTQPANDVLAHTGRLLTPPLHDDTIPRSPHSVLIPAVLRGAPRLSHRCLDTGHSPGSAVVGPGHRRGRNASSPGLGGGDVCPPWLGCAPVAPAQERSPNTRPSLRHSNRSQQSGVELYLSASRKGVAAVHLRAHPREEDIDSWA